MFFRYISPLVRMGYRRRLEEKDLPENLPAHDSQFLSEALERYSFSSHGFHSPKSSRQAIQHILKVILILHNYREWQKELRKERQSFFLALVRFAKVEVAISTILLLIVVRDKYSALMECKRMLSSWTFIHTFRDWKALGYFSGYQERYPVLVYVNMDS